MIAPYEHCRYAASVYGLSKHLHKTGCLVMVLRVIYTVSIEHHKIIIHILNVLEKGLKNVLSLMQVIEDYSCKVLCRI